MIIDQKSISMSEATKYLDKEKNKEFLAFAKKAKAVDAKTAENMRKSLEELEIMKLNDKHISKIIEMMPKDKEDLNKVVSEANLDETEQESVLNVVKN